MLLRLWVVSFCPITAPKVAAVAARDIRLPYNPDVRPDSSKGAPVSLGVGARFGHCEVTAKLGESGMGEVYRARNPKNAVTMAAMREGER